MAARKCTAGECSKRARARGLCEDHYKLALRPGYVAPEAKDTSTIRIPRGEAVATSKLTEDGVREIRKLYAAGGVTLVELGERFGVGKHTICDIIHRRTWAHVK